MILKGHPSHAALSRFADGDLGTPQHQRVADHLAGCERCRSEVAFMRQAGQLARALDTPAMPDSLLERIQERRQAGDRAILPLEAPGAEPPRRWRLVPGAAAAVALLAIGLFLSTGILKADRSGLHTVPERPRAGDTLTVQYHGGFEFSDLDRLLLRARFVTRSARSQQQIAGILERGDDGLFRTRVPLPDSVVYAAFAVENVGGDRVDHNGGRLWDVMVHGPDGRPTLDALTHRYLDILLRDSLEARRTVEALTELFPESPRGWWLEAARATRGSGSGRITAFYRDKLRMLERSFMDAPPADPDEFAVLGLFAATMGEMADLQHWTAEAERRGARSRWLALARTYVVVAHHRLPPAEALAELETIWQESPTPVASIAMNAWQQALEAHDWDAALRWLPRYREAAGHAGLSGMLSQLRDTFGPRATLDWALDHAETELLRTHASRRLSRTPREHERALNAEWQKLLASMSSMAAATGRSRLARDLAVQALTLAWETEALAAVGRILLEAGDTASAVVAFARVAADPAGPQVPAALTTRADWRERLETARYGLIRHVLEGSVVRYLPDELAPDTGPAVVAFLSHCGPDARAVRDLPAGAVTVYATSDVDSARAALKACGLDIAVRPDPDGRIAETFGLKTFQALFVTDAAGRVRFSHSAPEELPRELMTLRGDEPSVAD